MPECQEQALLPSPDGIPVLRVEALGLPARVQATQHGWSEPADDRDDEQHPVGDPVRQNEQPHRERDQRHRESPEPDQIPLRRAIDHDTRRRREERNRPALSEADEPDGAPQRRERRHEPLHREKEHLKADELEQVRAPETRVMRKPEGREARIGIRNGPSQDRSRRVVHRISLEAHPAGSPRAGYTPESRAA